ncbi:MAG: prolipoprotein diacylglyceryl transferase [Bacilli bacterium]|nr:prolipoprotein diacylglyceryl transferase [Bacilli bacterium]
MYPEFFVSVNEFLEKIGFSTYSIFLGIGIVSLLLYIIYILEKKNNYSRERTNKILLFLVIGLGIAYLGAWFFDSLFHYIQSGVFEGGMTFISGMLMGVGAFSLLNYLFNPQERGNILKLLNLIIPGVIIAHAFGRMGCFSVGCCYGRETDSVFGVLFPKGTQAYADGVRSPVHPTQLYEAVFLFLLFIGIRKIPWIKARQFPMYLILYGVYRAFMEIFIRGDDRGMLFNLPPSFVLSIFMISLGIFFLIYEYKKGRNNEPLLPK